MTPTAFESRCRRDWAQAWLARDARRHAQAFDALSDDDKGRVQATARVDVGMLGRDGVKELAERWAALE